MTVCFFYFGCYAQEKSKAVERLNMIHVQVKLTLIFLVLIMFFATLKAQTDYSFDDLVFDANFTIDVYWNSDGTKKYAVASTPSDSVFILDDAFNVIDQFNPNIDSLVPDAFIGPGSVQWSPDGTKLGVMFESAGFDFLQVWDVATKSVDTYRFGTNRIVALKQFSI